MAGTKVLISPVGMLMIHNPAIGFIANESISIIENAGLMGIPIPDVIRNAIEVLKKEASDDHKDSNNNNE
jgi:phage-related holin